MKTNEDSHLPRLLFTMGDVAGIGTEVLVKAWPQLQTFCRPIVVGDIAWLSVSLRRFLPGVGCQQIDHPSEAQPSIDTIPILCGSTVDLRSVRIGKVNANAGRAAYDFLCTAIQKTMNGEADGIVTAPLHKKGLQMAGLHYPGHTEILAEKTGTKKFAMMLYAQGPKLPHGLGVAHVTLHMALRDVFAALTEDAVVEKIVLLDQSLRRILGRPPRIGVCGLNPHASDDELFGCEETDIIRPAVERGLRDGITVTGPWPSDTLFVAAQKGDYDGVVAMYHDQGHIALKLLTDLNAVNVTLGLPIVRTSVAHGTAYDIAGKGIADHRSMVHAARIAALLVTNSGEPTASSGEPSASSGEPTA